MTLPRTRRYAVVALLGLVIGLITAPAVDALSPTWTNPRYTAGEGTEGYVSSPNHATQAGANNFLNSWAYYGSDNAGIVMYVDFPAFTVTGIKYEGYDLKDPRETANWACYGCTNAYWRVRNAQWLIWEFRYSNPDKSAIDGYWGWDTYRDVCTFQHWSGLTKDGIVGLYTWTFLHTAGLRNPDSHWDHQNCP